VTFTNQYKGEQVMTRDIDQANTDRAQEIADSYQRGDGNVVDQQQALRDSMREEVAQERSSGGGNLPSKGSGNDTVPTRSR
jgi:hypothetical protein